MNTVEDFILKIESEFDGTVKEILVENEQMVEFGQPMFVIE